MSAQHGFGIEQAQDQHALEKNSTFAERGFGLNPTSMHAQWLEGWIGMVLAWIHQKFKMYSEWLRHGTNAAVGHGLDCRAHGF